MTDLISRIGLLEDLGASCYDLDALTGVTGDERTLQEAIMQYPTVDAVPVVRCKSCMKRSTFECPMYSEIDGSDYVLDIIINDRTDDDGYCHCGARMDAEEDT